jgi:hypothetical protein
MRIPVVALLPAILCAQQAAGPDEIRVSIRPYVAQSPYSIRVETKLVEVNVAVRDFKGLAILPRPAQARGHERPMTVARRRNLR